MYILVVLESEIKLDGNRKNSPATASFFSIFRFDAASVRDSDSRDEFLVLCSCILELMVAAGGRKRRLRRD